MITTRRTALKHFFSFLSLPSWNAWHVAHAEEVAGAFHTVPKTPPATTSFRFGVGANQQILDMHSHYRVPEKASPQNRLSFDLSNNKLSCSFDRYGLLERAAIGVDVVPVDTHNTPVGAYVEKTLHRGGPWPVYLRIGSAAPVSLGELPSIVNFEEDIVLTYTFTFASYQLRMQALTPQMPMQSPSAVLLMFSLSSGKPDDVEAIELLLSSADADHFGGGLAEVLVARDVAWSSTSQHRSIRLADGTSHAVCVALLFAANAADLARNREHVCTRSPADWLEVTRSYHRSRLGQLSIPAEPYYAALFTRAAELARQSIILAADGSCIGSFNGSDLTAANNVWLRDFFYSALPQSVLDPNLCAKAVLFLLKWSIPSRLLGEHASKFPGADPVTNSLGNSVAGIVLAHAYYVATGDRTFFAQHPEILARCIEILERVLSSRVEDVYLFPSIYVSDGESRGDFHTGSNIFLWRAMSGFASFAADCYGQATLAEAWTQNASRLKEAILAQCVVQGAEGPRLVEAALQDHTSISGHDGEESDVTLAAYYDFCAEDDEAYLNAAAYAINRANPYAITEVEGIWWYAHQKWSSATFPGWITALASSRQEADLLRHLERIRSLTDADGSFWWWPYPHSDHIDVAKPLRTNSKCGWAAGTYVCWFRRHIVGLQVDLAAGTVRFAPFSPWSLAWTDCRFGATVFDLSYTANEGNVALTFTHADGEDLAVTLVALLPGGSEETVVRSVDASAGVVSRGQRYGRATVELRKTVSPGSRLSLLVHFTT